MLIFCSLSFAGGCAFLIREKRAYPPSADTELKARVEDDLRAHADVDTSRVTVSVQSGVIMVSGIVKTWDDKKYVERIVRAVRGVKDVVVSLLSEE